MYCQGADLCQELAGGADVTFTRVYEGCPTSRVITDTDFFTLVADLSPLVFGHLLLLPRRHYLSFAQVIVDHKSLVTEIVTWLTPLYEETFGPLVIMEHGSSSGADHSACITHAHWHILPVDGSRVDEIMLDDGLTPQDLEKLDQLGQPPWTESAYFLCSYDEHHRLYTTANTLPRQYLRSVAARTLSIREPEWDYTLVVRKHLLKATLDRAERWTCMP